jgi:predicted nucleic acid-binding protein
VTTPSASKLLVIDSTGWVEFWGDGPRAEAYAPYFERQQEILLPSVILYEVYKKLVRSRGKALADKFLSFAFRTQAVAFDENLALAAAMASLEHNLAMADAIIYVTAQSFDALLVTSDTHFKGLAGVQLI